jgi:uncharacterized protein YecE (DUF72 family)
MRDTQRLRVSKMNNIFIGTCSWTDRSLISTDEFYPKGVKTSEGRLRYYSSIFRCVEVDSSFYALPSERNSILWVERTPEDFVFNIKAFAVMTHHGIRPEALPPDLRGNIRSEEKGRVFIKDKEIIEEVFRRFKEAIEPIRVRNKLGIVVFQYPPWFKKEAESLKIILEAKRYMEDYEIGVEFRNRSWLDENQRSDTLSFLRDNQITYIISDAPQVRDSRTVPYIVDCTTDTAYFRFHGKNVENWLKKDIQTFERYDYEYNENELMAFASDIDRISRKVRRVFAMFNNHRGSQAIRNALTLKRILSN